MWHRMERDERIKICATEDCCVPASSYFLVGDIGSYYCSECKRKIESDMAINRLYGPGNE